MTTASTLLAVRKGIRDAHPDYPINFATPVVLVHRSDVYEIEGQKIVYLVHCDIQKWKPEDCPLCKAGSQRLKPKHHWAELTGQR